MNIMFSKAFGPETFKHHHLNNHQCLLVLQNAFDWGQVDKNALAKCLLTICRHIKDVLSEEPRLLKLKSPMYILGNILI